MKKLKVAKVNLNGCGEAKYYAVIDDDTGKQVSLHYETYAVAERACQVLASEEYQRYQINLQIVREAVVDRLLQRHVRSNPMFS